jgi:hypothetical protein
VIHVTEPLRDPQHHGRNFSRDRFPATPGRFL